MSNQTRLMIERLPFRALVVVLDGKGGTGKSTIAQTFASALGGRERVDCLSTDTSNANLNQLGLAALPPVDLSEPENIGHLLALVDRLGKSDGHALIDTGARDERPLLESLPALAQRAERNGATMIVVRPITLSHYCQANALNFARQQIPKIGCIFVRNLGQGREDRHFKQWRASAERAEALRRGVIETAIDNLGALIADNATSFNLSLEDVAFGDFRRAGQDQDRAEKLFEPSNRLFVAEFLATHGERFRSALLKAAATIGS